MKYIVIYTVTHLNIILSDIKIDCSFTNIPPLTSPHASCHWPCLVPAIAPLSPTACHLWPVDAFVIPLGCPLVIPSGARCFLPFRHPIYLTNDGSYWPRTMICAVTRTSVTYLVYWNCKTWLLIWQRLWLKSQGIYYLFEKCCTDILFGWRLWSNLHFAWLPGILIVFFLPLSSDPHTGGDGELICYFRIVAKSVRLTSELQRFHTEQKTCYQCSSLRGYHILIH